MPAMPVPLCWTTVLLFLFGLPLAAQVIDATAIVTQGNDKGAAPCITCHGADGAGQAAMGFPRLAGLNAAYLLKQLDSFAGGARSNPIMTPVAIALSSGERQALAGYYSQLPLPEPLSVSSNIIQAPTDGVGATLATRGRWLDSIYSCLRAVSRPKGHRRGRAFSTPCWATV